LSRLVEVVDKETEIVRLEIGEPKPKGLRRFAITQKYDSMPLIEIQMLNLDTVMVTPRGGSP
jgi:hypothetical protein